MVTLSPEAGQGSEPGMLLKRHPVGAPSAPWPRWLCHTLGRCRGGLELLPPGDREGCEAQQEALERMKH